MWNYTIRDFISGEKELVEFLADEIVAERKAQKSKSLPADIDGFKVKLEGADVEFVKDLGNEKWVFRWNLIRFAQLNVFSL